MSLALASRFEKSYTREQQELILCHELAHVTARDSLWIAISDLTAATLWWHPMIWWARLQLRRATEQTADEASAVVEGGPAALAECLVELAGRLRQSRVTRRETVLPTSPSHQFRAPQRGRKNHGSKMVR